MRVIVVGGGQVGFHLARRLSEEHQDVVLVDSDPERAEYAAEHLDVHTVVGNGASVPVLEDAGVRAAKLLLSVTSKDEVNLIACLAAKRMEVPHTIARISNPDYYTTGSVLSREQLGIDRMISPEREAAKEALQLLQSAPATDVVSFADGRVQLLGLRVKKGAPVAGVPLAELATRLGSFHYVTVAIVRDGRTLVPNGASTMEPGDQIYMLSPADEVSSIPALAGYEPRSLDRVMIAGGSLEGQYLAELLETQGVSTTILDRSKRRCLELAEALPKALVLHGDATDLELLELEGVAGTDGYVSATGDDQTNILSSLLAKSQGGPKVISLIEKFEYLPLTPKIGIDAAVSPRMSAVNAILRYIRRGQVLTMASLTGTEAEAMEVKVRTDCKVAGRAIEDVHFADGVIVGAILRDTEFISPRGGTVFEPGDDVIVFGLPELLASVDRMFA